MADISTEGAKRHTFFISYKWAKYAVEAKRLRAICDARKYPAWIDTENPFGTEARIHSDSALAAHLRAAMGLSEYVLFFETYATVVSVIGGPSQRTTSWQERELEMAEAQRLIVLYHGASPRCLTFGQNRNVHPYETLDSAFDLVEKAIAAPGDYF
jgi:hypothetical protein